MKKIVYACGLVLVLTITMVACQTNTHATSLLWPARSSIATEVDGFSPKADAPENAIDLVLTIGNPESVKAWKVEIVAQNAVIRTFHGTSSSMPSTLSWNGLTDSGAMGPEGTCIAVLNVYYRTRYATFTTESTPFVLDVEPPSGKLIISPIEAVPVAKGFSVPVAITVDATSTSAAIESWSVEILESSGRLVRGFSGTWPERSLSWDGFTSMGTQVAAAGPYRVVAKIRDIFGNTGVIDATMSVTAPPLVIAPSVTPAPPRTPEASSITARTRGFSPNGDAILDAMVFDLAFGQPQQVKAWKVEIMFNGKNIFTFSGTSALLPSTLSWDGKTASKLVANEGSYYAMFTIDYGGAFKAAIARSEAIILALSHPEGTITLSEPLYSPIESNPSIKISMKATSKFARMDSWSMRIYDPARNLFKSFYLDLGLLSSQ